MTLKEYLDRNELSLRAFAKRCGVSAPTILRVRDGLHMPSRKTLKAIVDATDGAVKIHNLIVFDDPEKSEGKNE